MHFLVSGSTARDQGARVLRPGDSALLRGGRPTAILQMLLPTIAAPPCWTNSVTLGVALYWVLLRSLLLVYAPGTCVRVHTTRMSITHTLACHTYICFLSTYYCIDHRLYTTILFSHPHRRIHPQCGAKYPVEGDTLQSLRLVILFRAVASLCSLGETSYILLSVNVISLRVPPYARPRGSIF